MQVRCPDCGSPSRVLESRSAERGAATRRRRECAGCGGRFTTFERVAVERLHVRKRDGRRQPFDAGKLRGALLRSAHKRDLSTERIDAIVSAVESEAAAAGGVIGAARIGEICLERLRRLDRGAYLQFAGTLPAAVADLAEAGTAGSVRLAREHAELPPDPVKRREIDG